MKIKVLNCTFQTDEADDFSCLVRGIYVPEIRLLIVENNPKLKDKPQVSDFPKQEWLYNGPTYPELSVEKEIEASASEKKTLCKIAKSLANVTKHKKSIYLINKNIELLVKTVSRIAAQ